MLEDLLIKFIGTCLFVLLMLGFVWVWVLGPYMYFSGKLDFVDKDENVKNKKKETSKTQKLKGRNVPIVSEYDPKYEL